MRTLLATIVMLLSLQMVPVPQHSGVIDVSASVLQEQQPSQPAPDARVDIDIRREGGGGNWYASPVWIAIGVIGVVVLILLVVLATRGGGTTVVRG